MPVFATRLMTSSSEGPVDIPKKYVVGQQRQQISQLRLDKFPVPQLLMIWKTRFKTQVSSGSDFPSDAMLWIREVEMVDSLADLKSSGSIPCEGDSSKNNGADQQRLLILDLHFDKFLHQPRLLAVR